MKICMLTDAWLPIWGGGQEHIKQIANILQEKHGCDVDMLAPNIIWPKFQFNNFFHRVAFTLYTVYFFLTSDYYLYHSHSFSTSAFLPLVKLRGKRTAVTVHGMGKDLRGGGVLNFLGIGHFLLWLVVFVWQYDCRFSASKIDGYMTLGNGVNTDDFDAVKVRKDSKKFRIFWIGRPDDPVKGLKFLESAADKVKRRFPKVELDLAMGNVFGQEKIRRFKLADLYVLPSLSEGLPIVILEAMAASLPVVATKVGDVPKVVKDGVNGYLVEPGSTDDLEKAILKAISNPRLNNMGKAGRMLVEERYQWDPIVQKIFQAYGGSTGKEKSGSPPVESE